MTESQKSPGNFSHHRALLCTGKQKIIEKLDAWLRDKVQKGEIAILARTQVHRTKLLRHFEEVRVLFGFAGQELTFPKDLTENMDYFQVTEKAQVTIKASSPKVIDEWLKWNIKEQTAPFQLRGGTLAISEEKERQANGAVWRTCHYTLRGEVSLVFKYRDKLAEQKLANPETYSYEF